MMTSPLCHTTLAPRSLSLPSSTATAATTTATGNITTPSTVALSPFQNNCDAPRMSFPCATTTHCTILFFLLWSRRSSWSRRPEHIREWYWYCSRNHQTKNHRDRCSVRCRRCTAFIFFSAVNFIFIFFCCECASARRGGVEKVALISIST
jgi:hypothetical protein